MCLRAPFLPCRKWGTSRNGKDQRPVHIHSLSLHQHHVTTGPESCLQRVPPPNPSPAHSHTAITPSPPPPAPPATATRAALSSSAAAIISSGVALILAPSPRAFAWDASARITERWPH